MIDLLRFIGLVNAAVWFGSAVYHVLGIDPAVAPAQLDAVLGSRNAPYFSELIEQAFLERYFWLHLFCGSIAILHAFAEWLYLGRTPRRWWVGLIGALFALNLLSGLALSPHLATLHATRYAVNYPAERRMAAARAFGFWNGTAQVLRVLVLAGTVVYFWRTANPASSTRFNSAAKFRS